MATTNGSVLLACVALLGGAARAGEQVGNERSGTERAADVMGGQGRGTGSGKSSSEKDLGVQDGTTSGASERARAAEIAAGTPGAREGARVPADPKMARAGGLREPER
jgi:hypothetical protein